MGLRSRTVFHQSCVEKHSSKRQMCQTVRSINPVLCSLIVFVLFLYRNRGTCELTGKRPEIISQARLCAASSICVDETAAAERNLEEMHRSDD